MAQKEYQDIVATLRGVYGGTPTILRSMEVGVASLWSMTALAADEIDKLRGEVAEKKKLIDLLFAVLHEADERISDPEWKNHPARKKAMGD